MKTLQEHLKVSDRRLIDLFKKWDEDRSGQLEIPELASHLQVRDDDGKTHVPYMVCYTRETNCPLLQDLPTVRLLGLSRGDWRMIQKQLDTNNDKKISFKACLCASPQNI